MLYIFKNFIKQYRLHLAFKHGVELIKKGKGTGIHQPALSFIGMDLRNLNFISLQKVLTNLSGRFDELSDNMSKLLQLFEISAKTFAEKYQTKN